MRMLHNLLILAGSVIFFLIFYVIARSVMPVLPPVFLWGGADFAVEIAGYMFPFFDLLFFLSGLVVFCHGVLYLVHVNTYPDSLDTLLSRPHADPSHGPYARVRHPLYTAFTMIELGLFSSLRSVYAVGFVCFLFLLQLASAVIEEELYLKKKYPVRLTQYRESVPRRFFSRALTVYTVLVFVLTAGGIYTLLLGAE